MNIKLKLIILFIVMKVIPLILVVIIATQGVKKVNEYFLLNTKMLLTENKSILRTTTTNAINDSIIALDKTSQESLEKLGVMLASKVADFLYERDNDILFLSKVINKNNFKSNIESFYLSKNRDILVHAPYKYNEHAKRWESAKKIVSKNEFKLNILDDNKKNFHAISKKKLDTKSISIYKEISFFDINGKEIYKKSSISKKLLNISNKKNTYCKAEDYFEKIKNLKQNEIYVSDVIGAYIRTKVIGTFTKEKAKKMKISFNPEEHAYAGIENPNGKRFEGIIRFITPIYDKSVKIGYISLALDHRHIMEFTDSFNPVSSNIKQNISNARDGNYAFMWDYETRNISHPRDYFITGFDKNTGKRVPGWMSKNVADDFKNSQVKDINEFLKSYPKFKNQSLKQKPNMEQFLKKGEVGLDCRYLNFAPQCHGWWELTKNGGDGSFIIFWSKVWKLSTAATIPYYTGQYSNTKRGFGFITIGANVDEFHKAANNSKINTDQSIKLQFDKMEKLLNDSKNKISNYIQEIISDLSISTLWMILLVIIVAVWMSNIITNRVKHISEGIKQFSKNNLDYQLPITSNDEIGELEKSFNSMAKDIKKEHELNKQKEKILMEQSKMASMGNMISNIAHQWRQPLSVISTISSGLIVKNECKVLDDDIIKSDMNKIIKSTQYLSETINTFRNFTKDKKDKKKLILQDKIDKAIEITSSVLKNSKIKIKKEIDYSCAIIINAVEGELIQVIINILNNAKDALAEKNIKDKYIKIVLSKNNKLITITIEDNAGGIPMDIIDKIFEPYFTTKQNSNGTGIGLHMSYKIIKESFNGNFYVKNTNQGAKFFIELPIT